MSAVYSLGVDIGGTFTDFTLYNHATGEVLVEKVLTTPGAPYEAVFTGIEQLEKTLPGFLANANRVTHATTLVTNAILERKGAPTALVTTRGFRDVLETRLENRYDVYDLNIRFPEPIVPREHRFGVTERVYSDGAVKTPLSEAEVRAVAARIREAGLKSVAICFIHACRNPEHERRAAGILREELPGDVAFSVSHEVSPEPREYQRSSTTVLDAYVKPPVSKYLASLESGLKARGYRNTLEMMLSNGGSTSARNARDFPIQLIESGPAAGVEASGWTCRLFGIQDALSFDMGGTTAKLCILRDGIPERARKFEAAREHRFVAGSGMPVTVPVYDLVEIGAGGGSIASLDGLNLLSVGPVSASSVPGPACYGRGGMDPTVTDADLVLGYLDPEYFLGGDMPLDLQAARDAIGARIAGPLDIPVEEAAYAIVDLVNETMAAAARLHIAEKGCDPRKLTLIAFGGAGPLHALELGRKLGCPAVVFPPCAGVMSSLGLLTAPPAFERMKTVKIPLEEANHQAIAGQFSDVHGDVIRIIGRHDDMQFRHVAELWYRGQEYPLDVQLEGPPSAPGDITVMRQKFLDRYKELYGRLDEGNVIEVVALRVIGSFGEGIAEVRLDKGTKDRNFDKRQVYDHATRAFAEVDVVSRADLPIGRTIEGPLVIQDRESGIVVRKGNRLTVRENGAIFVELHGGTTEQAVEEGS